MARYFLYGYYGFGNYGDDLLLNVLVSRVRERDPSAEFVVRARAVVPTLVNDPGVRFLLAESMLEDRRRNRFARFVSYRAALIAEVRKCDVLVIGGGTLFIDKGQMNWSLIFIYEAARAARSAGRRVVVTGVAIDILAHPISVWIMRRIFGLANFSAVRDTLSLAYFQDTAKPPLLTADLAWLTVLPAITRSNRSRTVVGLNFIDYFRSSTQSEDGHRAYREAIIRLIERHRQSCDFHLIALQKGIGQRDDWFADEFHLLVPDGKVFYVDSQASLVKTLECIDAVVTTRFHLALLAARSGIATSVVDHELKLTSLAQDLYLPSIPLQEFVTADCLDPLERLKSWDPLATQRASVRLAARAEKNFGWMAS